MSLYYFLPCLDRIESHYKVVFLAKYCHQCNPSPLQFFSSLAIVLSWLFVYVVAVLPSPSILARNSLSDLTVASLSNSSVLHDVFATQTAKVYLKVVARMRS
jgi:hypothetical protein